MTMHTIPTPLMLSRQANMQQHPATSHPTDAERREQEAAAWDEHDKSFRTAAVPGDRLPFNLLSS